MLPIVVIEDLRKLKRILTIDLLAENINQNKAFDTSCQGL